jgi:hypothetical protein
MESWYFNLEGERVLTHSLPLIEYIMYNEINDIQ